MNGADFAVDVLVRVTEENIIIGLVRSVLDTASNAGEKGVGNVGDDQANILCTAGGKAAGDAVGPVAQSVSDAKDPFTSLGADLALVVDRSRYSLWGNACFACDVLDRDSAAHS
jgi:hypothetical protein